MFKLKLMFTQLESVTWTIAGMIDPRQAALNTS